MHQELARNWPPKFTRVISGAFGSEGRIWLDSLPALISEIEQHWAVEIKKPYENLSYHFVAPCVAADGAERVVKIGFPGEKDNIRNELKALQAIDGRGSARLYDFDEQRFCFLLEKLDPGENLKSLCRGDEQRAVPIAIEVMRNFWRKPPAGFRFPRLNAWFENLSQAEAAGFARTAANKARLFYEQLQGAAGSEMLLHGDFHHENILSAERAPFLAIDPKGILGRIGYDIAVFLNNHARWLNRDSNRGEKLNRAVKLFSASFAIEPESLKKWAFTQSILSAWWGFEENSSNWKNELDFAEIWQV